jgi:hypothetical protein
MARLRAKLAAIQQRLTHLPIALRKKGAAAVKSIKSLAINHVSIKTNQKNS